MYQEFKKEERQEESNVFGSVEVINDLGKILVERSKPKPDWNGLKTE